MRGDRFMQGCCGEFGAGGGPDDLGAGEDGCVKCLIRGYRS